MLSVVLYGRNDSHGYNLQKRAAISLNCIAEILDAPDDEIIFVDYNTPVDLPTFPEAIADTLSAACRERLRVLRVPPGLHRELGLRTHLVAIEPVSRNAAVRRANPANRWILSTNTDMVFAPKTQNSLSAIVARLPDGFYGLPRFDMPQALWESVDRMDGRGTIETFRRWGRDFHIDEIVYGNDWIVYDAPGDFQLVTRSDIVAIHGFNEAMVLGWHVDSNFCKRMVLHRGPVQGLDEHLAGYHCDHSRQATLMSQSNKRIENDLKVFFDAVDSPFIPEQAESWGLAGHDLEEIRLAPGRLHRCANVLAGVLPPPPPEPYRACYTGETFNRMDYPVEHAFPYLLDHLMTYPADADIAYFGGSRRFFERMRAAWQDMAFTGRLLVSPKIARLLGIGSDGEEDAPVTVTDLDAVLKRSSAYVFEFGTDTRADFDPAPFLEEIRRATPGSDAHTAASHRLSRQRIMALDECAKACLGVLRAEFLHTVRRERMAVAGGRSPRKFYGVNAVHNIFDGLLAEELTITWAPYTLRLRHGYARPERALPPPHPRHPDLQSHMTASLARGCPVEPLEMEMVEADLRRILAANDLDAVEAWRFTEPMHAYASWPEAAALLGVERGTLESVAKQVAIRRPAATLRGTVRLPAAPPCPTVGLSKLCAAEDWEHPDWFDGTHSYAIDALLTFSASTANYFKRSRGLWERGQMLYAMERLGMLQPQAHALVVAPAVDGLYLHLSNRLARVDVAGVGSWADGADESAWFAKSRLCDRGALHMHRGLPATPFVDGLDAALATQNVVFRDGRDEALRRLAWIDARLRPQGMVALSVCVGLDGRPAPGLLLPADLERFVHAVECATGWRLEGPFDWTLSDATLDRTARAGTGETQRPHLVVRSDRALYIPGLLVFRRTASVSANWQALADALPA